MSAVKTAGSLGGSVQGDLLPSPTSFLPSVLAPRGTKPPREGRKETVVCVEYKCGTVSAAPASESPRRDARSLAGMENKEQCLW